MKIKKINKILKSNKNKFTIITISIITVLISLFYYNTLNATMINLSTLPDAEEIKKEMIAADVHKKLLYLFDNNEKRVKFIIDYSNKNNISPLFTAAVIFAESDNRQMATSRVFARGLMQLMQPTAVLIANSLGEKELAIEISKNPKILYNTELNIRFGTLFLRNLRNMYRDWKETLHAYNVGPNAFRFGRRNFAYVNKIMSMFNDWENMDIATLHSKYSNYLSNLYSKKMEIIVMR